MSQLANCVNSLSGDCNTSGEGPSSSSEDVRSPSRGEAGPREPHRPTESPKTSAYLAEAQRTHEGGPRDGEAPFRAPCFGSLASSLSPASAVSGSAIELQDLFADSASDHRRTSHQTLYTKTSRSAVEGHQNEPSQQAIPNEDGFCFKNYDWLASDFIGSIRQSCLLSVLRVLTCLQLKAR